MKETQPVVVVTGASRGIGRAIVEDLAANGFRVAAVARSGDKLGELEDHFGRNVVLGLTLDISDPVLVETIPQHVVAHFGQIDGLVNNAGASEFGDFGDLPLSAWTDAYQLKLFGYVRAIKAVLPLFLKEERGVVVNIAGNGGKQVSPYHMIGGSLNAAIIHLTRALAVEYGSKGLRFNAVSPGPIETERLTSLLRSQASASRVSEDEALADFVSGVPLNRLGSPAEVARLVRFLLGPESSYITGENVLIDGGMVRGV